MFMGDFGHTKTAVKFKLFKQYCCSYYGAPLWDLQSKSVGNICIAWRKALRQLWGLASLTHGDAVSLVSDSLPLLVKKVSSYIARHPVLWTAQSTLHVTP